MPLDTTPPAPALIRPALLARAAARVARGYRRDRDLSAALPGHHGLASAQRCARLAEVEAQHENARRAGAPGYRPVRHVLLLGALLAETAAAQPKASGSDALRDAT